MITLLNHLSLRFSLVLFTCALLLVGCNDDDDDDSPSPTPTPAVIDFGASYQIVDGTISQGANPILVGDSVFIRVGYSGCADNHEFQFRSRVLSDTRAEVWMEKITEDESCSAFFTLDEVHRVPFSVLEREKIFLVGPDFYTFQLR
jgi:hypothetical protein